MLAECEGWIAGTAPITAEMIALAPNLKIIARYGVGFESIDIDAANSHKVIVTNTPGANSLAVAELAMALIFASQRGIVKSANQTKINDWSVIRGRQIQGSIVGIIGFGNIGRLLAAKLKALGCEIWIHDPYVNKDEILEAGYLNTDLIEITRFANIVSLNSPGDSKIIDRNWIENAKESQVIINSARSDLIDESALAHGLRSGKISKYAADTVSGEGSGQKSELLAPEFTDNVIITSHIGAQTVEAIDAMGKMASENVIAVLNGKLPLNPVRQ